MPDSIKWLEDFGDGRRVITSIAAELQCMSLSFRRVGNGYISEKLTDIANDLVHASDTMNKAVNDNINDQCQRSQEGLAGALSFAIKHVAGEE